MKTKKLNCAWTEFCDGKITMTIEIVNNHVQCTYSKCKKCGNFSIVEDDKIIKYHPNK